MVLGDQNCDLDDLEDNGFVCDDEENPNRCTCDIDEATPTEPNRITFTEESYVEADDLEDPVEVEVTCNGMYIITVVDPAGHVAKAVEDLSTVRCTRGEP